MEYLGRVGGNPNNPDALPIHGNVQRFARLRCGDDDIVLFERPRPLNRDALDQDGIAHQAFDMNWEDYGDALKTVRSLANFIAASSATAAIPFTCSIPRATISNFTSQDRAAGARVGWNRGIH